MKSTAQDLAARAIEPRVAAGGEIRWQQWTDRGLFDSDGRLLEYQAVGRDITERKRAEEEQRLRKS